MPILAKLHAAGFSIWPFDPPRLPMVVEIYPRYFTGPVEKSNAIMRSYLLQTRPVLAELPEHIRGSIAKSEDAFDAMLSALGMWDNCPDFARLRQATDSCELLEGCIWTPSDRRVN
jgi:hypothetical protein